MAHPGQENLIPIKPGEVRNPNGRPKGSKNYATIIKKAMKTKVKIKEHPLTRKPNAKMTVREMVVFAMIKEAANGNVSAFEKLADREEGKVPQTIRPAGPENPAPGEKGMIILCWQGEEDGQSDN